MRLLFRKYHQFIGASLASILLISPLSLAQNVDVHFAGFASLVYAKTITDDKKEDTLYGISDEGEYRDFNKLGFRMDADMHDNLTFTAQILASGANEYDPTFDWIFVKYQLHPEVSISAGRIRVPVFMYSDYLDTSYAYQWIEPPKTVYNLAQTPFKSIEGVKLAYNTNMKNWTSELLVWGGNGDDKFDEAGVEADLILEDSMGIAWTVGYDWLSLRAFYFEADSTLDITTNATLGDLISGTGAVFGGTNNTPLDPGNLSVANIEAIISATTSGAINPNFQDALLWEKDPGQFYGLGASLDFERYFVIAEMTRIDVKGSDSNLVTPTLDSFYVTAGIRLPAQWTLSLTYGEDKDHVDDKTWEQFSPYIGPSGVLGGALDALLVPYQLGMKALAESTQDFQSKETTLGARWDFHRSAALKLEWIHDKRSGGYLGNQTQTPQAVRVGIDLVF
jgi:uncharacterized Fe-S cluster protein YjdI